MSEDAEYGKPWNNEEIQAAIEAYFKMFDYEKNRKSYSKSEINKELQAKIGRTKGSIEFKFQNISAVLNDLNRPWLTGYKPASNYQKALSDAVKARMMTQNPKFTLTDLEQIVASRAAASPEESWTAKLTAAGPVRIAKKFGEEAVEAVIAGAQGDRGALIAESADVLYHLLVLLHARRVSVNEVLGELERRTAQSGLQEKASRPT